MNGGPSWRFSGYEHRICGGRFSDMAWRVSARVRQWREAPPVRPHRSKNGEAAMHRSKNEPGAAWCQRA